MDKKEDQNAFKERTSNQETFDKRLVFKIVKMVEDGSPRKELMATYGMSNSALLDWMRRYGSPEYHNRKQLRIAASEKRTIVRAIMSGKMTIGEAVIAYNLKTGSLPRRWINDYKKEIGEFRTKNDITYMPASESLDEITHLKKAVEQLKLRNQALDTMIDIAEEELNINIRKKYGAKQS
jgi:transposase